MPRNLNKTISDRNSVLRNMTARIENLANAAYRRTQEATEMQASRKRAHDEDLAAAQSRHDEVRRMAEAYQERYEQERLDSLHRAEQAEKAKQAVMQESQRLHAEKHKLEMERENLRIQKELEEVRKVEEEKLKKEQEEARRVQAEKDKEKAEKRRKEAEEAEAQLRTDENAAALLLENSDWDREEEAKAAQEKLDEARAKVVEKKGLKLTLGARKTSANKYEAEVTKFVDDVARREYGQYMAVHSRLKELRKNMKKLVKENPALKAKMGDMRREIVKRIGQTSEHRDSIKTVQPAIASVLEAAAQDTASPSIHFADYYLEHKDNPVEDASALARLPEIRVPALFVYLTNCYAKALVQQLRTEAASKPMIAESLGILTAKLSSQISLHPHALPLLPSIILTKFAAAVPLAFGSYGGEETPAGRRACGWRFADKSPNQAWTLVPETEHFDDQLALATGLSSIMLRIFAPELAPLTNQYPSWRFWQMMHRLSHIPVESFGSTSLTVLKGLMRGKEGSQGRIFGTDGAVALRRQAFVHLPDELTRSGRVGSDQPGSPTEAAFRGLTLVGDDLRRQYGPRIFQYSGQRE